MIGFRKKSLPGLAPAGLPRKAMISVAALAARRAFATSEFPGYVALIEPLP